MILHRYFARRFFMTYLGIVGVFLLIITSVDIVEQLRRFSSADASFVDVLILTLLNVPRAFSSMLPLIMILSSVAFFLSMARSSEMVVTRAAGRSAMRAMLAPLAVTLMIGLLAVAVLNPIVAATSKAYETRSDSLRGSNSVLSLGSSGLWLRQGDANGQTVIRAEGTNLDGTRLTDVTFMTFTPEGAPARRINAGSAQLSDGSWVLHGVKSWPLQDVAVPEAAATTLPQIAVPSTLTPDQIRNSFGTPLSIPIWELPAFIDRLQTAGFSAQRHLVWFHAEIALPVFLIAMVLIGATFTLRHQRGGRTGLMVLFAVILAFVVYFFRNFTQVLGENGDLPAMLAAWAPPLAAIALSLGALLHHEDG